MEPAGDGRFRFLGKGLRRLRPGNQALAYALTRSWHLPPSNRYTGTPNSLAEMSHSAISTALRADINTGPVRQ